MRRLSTSLLLVLAVTWVVYPHPPQVHAAQVNPDALVLQEFTERIERYLELRKPLEKESPRLEETRDPAEIRAAQQTLAKKIREARAGARQGEIFTPAIRAKFRQLIYPEVKGLAGADTQAAIKEDAPAAIRLKINAEYPEHAPLPTMPSNLLANLPSLPEELEYRIVDKHLILRDVDANVIVDFIPNAIR